MEHAVIPYSRQNITEEDIQEVIKTLQSDFLTQGPKIGEFEEKFADKPVPRPPHWSGWRILPKEIEFWLDGEGRIHERLNYINQKGKWAKEILYP